SRNNAVLHQPMRIRAKQMLRHSPRAHMCAKSSVVPYAGYLCSNELPQMLGHASTQRRQRVAAFQRRDDSPFRIFCRDLSELARDPAVIGFDEFEVGERIFPVRVEAGG